MVCPKCGNEAGEGAKFCVKCGQAIGPAADEAETFTLTVNRAKQFYLIDPTIKIYVDGQRKPKYRLKNGQTVHIPVSAGTHNFYFKHGGSIESYLTIHFTGDVVLNMKLNRITGEHEFEGQGDGL